MRKFIIGVDGGGTKTIAVLSDLEGNIVCSDKTSGINYQIIGIDTASETITKLIRNLLKRAKIGSEEISFLLLGKNQCTSYLPSLYILCRDEEASHNVIR